jgi:hypothetical protein
MILYGLLIKMSVLGSSDGFNIAYSTAAGVVLRPGTHLYASMPWQRLSCLSPCLH